MPSALPIPSASGPDSFAASGHHISRAVGFAPRLSSAESGWNGVALYGWRGQCGEAEFEPFDEAVIVYHVGGAQSVPVRVGRNWGRATHPGLLTIIPPATRISWDIRGEVDSRTVHLGSKFFATEAGEPIDLPGLRFRCGVQDPLLTAAIQALERELCSPSQQGTLYADAVSNFMARHLLRESEHGTAAPARPLGLSRRRLDRVLERIEASIECGISLQSLADEAALSRSHFASAFRAATGVSPHRYLTQRRLEQARGLLAEGVLNLSQIALRCGFSSQAHFTEYFRRELGVTPREYRITHGAADRSPRRLIQPLS